MTRLKSLTERLGRIDKESVLGYGRRPIPTGTDDEISGLVSDCPLLEPSERDLVSSSLVQWQSSTLLCYAERMAALAVRRGSSDLLWSGLVAIAMEGGRFDPRENLIALALTNHSAAKIGADPGDLMRRAAGLAGDSLAKLTTSFDNRPSTGKAIESMGFRETYLGGEFSYQYVE